MRRIWPKRSERRLVFNAEASAALFITAGTTLSGEACDSLGRCVASTFRRSAVMPWDWISLPPPVEPPSLAQVTLWAGPF